MNERALLEQPAALLSVDVDAADESVCGERRHHTMHEFGWALELAPDRELANRQPDGSVVTVTEPDVPPPRSPARTRRRAAA